MLWSSWALMTATSPCQTRGSCNFDQTSSFQSVWMVCKRATTLFECFPTRFMAGNVWNDRPINEKVNPNDSTFELSSRSGPRRCQGNEIIHRWFNGVAHIRYRFGIVEKKTKRKKLAFRWMRFMSWNDFGDLRRGRFASGRAGIKISVFGVRRRYLWMKIINILRCRRRKTVVALFFDVFFSVVLEPFVFGPSRQLHRFGVIYWVVDGARASALHGTVSFEWWSARVIAVALLIHSFKIQLKHYNSSHLTCISLLVLNTKCCRLVDRTREWFEINFSNPIWIEMPSRDCYRLHAIDKCKRQIELLLGLSDINWGLSESHALDGDCWCVFWFGVDYRAVLKLRRNKSVFEALVWQLWSDWVNSPIFEICPKSLRKILGYLRIALDFNPNNLRNSSEARPKSSEKSPKTNRNFNFRIFPESSKRKWQIQRDAECQRHLTCVSTRTRCRGSQPRFPEVVGLFSKSILEMQNTRNFQTKWATSNNAIAQAETGACLPPLTPKTCWFNVTSNRFQNICLQICRWVALALSQSEMPCKRPPSQNR